MKNNIRINELCYSTLSKDNPNSFETYVSLGGYSTWKNIVLSAYDKKEIIETVMKSGLRGRGGAGFPTGRKWSFINQDSEEIKYLVCNADESEPGTCKDRDILRYNPHALIEGMLIASYAIGADTAYCYLRGEFIDDVYSSFKVALDEAYKNKFIGKNVLNTSINIEIHDLIGAGAYIVGEETAMLESIEGKKGFPRFKPPFPAVKGLFGSPTIINNVETLASIPKIMENGPEWFNSVGTKDSPGFKCFSVSGHVNKPGNFEIPLGTPFKKLLELAGGMKNGKKIKAVIPGGSSVPVVPGEVMLETNMDYESISQAGSMLGSGAVIVMDEDTNMVEVIHRIARFYYSESCGQCTPCREGTGWMFKIIDKILCGNGNLDDIKTLESIPKMISGSTICALGDAAAMPVESFMKNYKEEFLKYIKDKKEEDLYQEKNNNKEFVLHKK
ncbi:MAG: NADH-quinone oxidoreductase subunit NuoF [Gammaproteobacteria bacterium]|jgi:NADH-quinone oxidoreductase subunit F|nr:NADH-quinone oxidoreductase subunit NuoF [Gammaproteobacteria bacterium]MDG2172063.1 NADH-quinone oxidoreductase subunit NuoF [Gammaproteobacteria bacterium]